MNFLPGQYSRWQIIPVFHPVSNSVAIPQAAETIEPRNNGKHSGLRCRNVFIFSINGLILIAFNIEKEHINLTMEFLSDIIVINI
ncbi:hypothetical protein C4588_05855 [Candidatus Parcubacteria bacterium]|nr:MAG: hypothetical protein C4588_05855 [Candidatus Parcubacteria bacterium]